jgi:multiple sugar transport system permease protein
LAPDRATNFLIYFRNSVILSTVTTVVVVAIGTLGAYSLVRFKFRGRESLAFLVLCSPTCCRRWC